MAGKKEGSPIYKGRSVEELSSPRKRQKEKCLSEEAKLKLQKYLYMKRIQLDIANILEQIGKGKIPPDVFGKVRKHQNPFA